MTRRAGPRARHPARILVDSLTAPLNGLYGIENTTGQRLLIPVLMSVFALVGTSYGMAEESLAFYALVITVMIAAGYDALTGAAIVLLGCGIARGPKHHRGDEIGSHGTKIVVVQSSPDSEPSPAVRKGVRHRLGV